MKASTIPAVTSLTLLLAGCGSVLTVEQPPPECILSTSIAVQWGPGRLEIDNECIYVAEGNSITMTLTPDPAVNAARTKFKGFGNKWLDRSNRDPDNAGTIMLQVPNGKGGKSYKYEIHVEGVGVLDPRIVIQ